MEARKSSCFILHTSRRCSLLNIYTEGSDSVGLHFAARSRKHADVVREGSGKRNRRPGDGRHHKVGFAARQPKRLRCCRVNRSFNLLALRLPLSSCGCSYDGVPFLMHDYNLQRTTNVREVFPNRTGHPAAMFTWSELEDLNAGSWFLSVSPGSFSNTLKLPVKADWLFSQPRRNHATGCSSAIFMIYIKSINHAWGTLQTLNSSF